MAPNKFEDHIRTQLEKRRIDPSNASWEKLSARLDVQETKSNSKWWLGIAAALALGLIAITGINFFEGSFEGPQVAEEPINKEVEIEKPIEILEEDSKTEIAETDSKVKKEAIQLNDVGIPEKIFINKATAPSAQKRASQQSIAASSEPKSTSNISESVVMPIQSTIIEHKISPKLDEVVVVADIKEVQIQSVTNEVDALLLEASSSTSSSIGIQSYSANAAALLKDVEVELEPTFRNKVFEMLKDGYVKAKTAVVTRNN